MAVFRSFGKKPFGNGLLTIQQSNHYGKGGFENLSPTQLSIGTGKMMQLTWKMLNKPANTAPAGPLPSQWTDLLDIGAEKPVIVWFGHSSYLIRINGKNILVDPVLSGKASPFSFGVNSFAGTNSYTAADMPIIDILVITHDHYDHLDHRTIGELKPKIKKIVTSLGVGSHLRYWGIDPEIITELDWWENVSLENIELMAAPARHFSGRSLKRNQTLWSSFILKAGDYKIYIGADSGYDDHFKTIGEKSGPFDLVILETGQYNQDWPQIHMTPEEAVQAAVDLQAKYMLPVHWAKFALAFHPWYEPPERVWIKAKETGMPVTTPLIGEPVILDTSYPNKQWWKEYM